VVRRISSNISGCTGPIFTIFSPYKSALRADDGTLYLIFQFVKGRGHGNQIMLRNESKLILCAFFARSPDRNTVSFGYYLLGGDTAALSRLLARLCHAFFVFIFFFLMISGRQIISGYAGPIFATFSPNESVLNADDRSDLFFRYLKGRYHGNRFCEKMANSPLSLLWH